MIKTRGILLPKDIGVEIANRPTVARKLGQSDFEMTFRGYSTALACHGGHLGELDCPLLD